LVVSAIEVYEVYKVIRRDLSEERALEAADVALERRLAMADAIVYATARRVGATLVTADADFEDLPNVVLIR